MSPAAIAGLVVGLAVLIVAVAVPVWYVTRGEASTAPTSTSTFGLGESDSSDMIVQSTWLHAPRFGTRSSAEILASCHQNADQSYLCDTLPEEWFRLTEQYHFAGPVHDNAETSAPQMLFVPRGPQCVTLPLDNVTGTFFAVYLQFENDMWGNGFDVSVWPDRDIHAEVHAMETAVSQAVVLVGADVVPHECRQQATYDFDALYPVSVPMNVVTDHLNQLDVVSGARLKGVVRMSAEFVDYHFRVAATEHKVRVLLTDCKGQMGDKLMYVNGSFRWLDMATQQFTSVRNENCLSFWNQQQFRSGPEEQKPEVQQERTRQALVEAFRVRRLGVPIELVNTSVDFRLLLEPGHRVRLDLIVDGHLSFFADDGFTEQALAGSPKEILMRFDIPDMNFKANVTIA